MKRILIYYGENKRAVDQQSVMELFCSMGHEVFLLTQSPPGEMHELVKPYGVKTFSYVLEGVSGPRFFYKHIRYLIKFIKENQIDTVFAHLPGAGLIAGLARKFHKFEYFYVRHFLDAHIFRGGIKEKIMNSMVDRVSPKIIAVSTAVEKYLIETEKVNPKRIRQINNAFNFDQYLNSDYKGNASEIRASHPASVLLINIGRLVPFKRHSIAIKLVHELRLKGIDAKMIILGFGYMEAAIQAEINSYDLQDSIWLAGRVRNVLDYLEASDILVHFSETEALAIAVVEAGLMKKPVIVCENVGVFGSFISDDESGYFVDKNNPIPESISLVQKLSSNPELCQRLGNNLNKSVHENFDIKSVAAKYEAILAES